MRERIRNLWDIVRSGLWFIPTLLAIASALLSVFTIAYDQSTADLSGSHNWVYGGEPAGARSVLTAIAGSIATVAGVVFSISIVVTTLVSQQFGPRVVREFLRDVTNQLVLGTFIGTFVYALLVLRRVREGSAPFVPHLSVTIAMIMAVISLLVLIIFLHHQASLTRAATIVPRLSRHLHENIARQFSNTPQRINIEPGAITVTWAHTVEAEHSGYVQTVDLQRVLRIACERDCVIRILRKSGDFILRGEALAELSAGKRLRSTDLRKVQRTFTIGIERTQAEDLEFAVEQILQIALRALSPAVNDPVTAQTCIDYLASALLHFMEAEPCSHALGAEGAVRVLMKEHSFGSFLSAVLDPLRPSAAEQTTVTLRLLERLRYVAEHARTQEQKLALKEQLGALIHAVVQRPLPDLDLRCIREHYAAAIETLQGAIAVEDIASEQGSAA